MTNDIFTFSLKVFVGFFAVMNPIANTPIFLGLVSGKDPSTKKKIANTACTTAFIIVVVFVILGKLIFELFGITIPAFKITGGILLFWIGFEMLQSKRSNIHHQEEQERDEGFAISPLAIPILAGPGTIVTAMNNVIDGNLLHIGIVIVVFGLLIYLTYLTFSLSNWIVKKIGKNLIMVIGKIMGLILSIMGTGMVIEGIKIAFDLS